jgi:hypothetical protein
MRSRAAVGALDIDARIAALDERLKAVRQENYALRERVSAPAPASPAASHRAAAVLRTMSTPPPAEVGTARAWVSPPRDLRGAAAGLESPTRQTTAVRRPVLADAVRLEEAEVRLRDVEERAVRNQHALADLQAKRAAAQRQTEELLAAAAGNNARATELERQKQALDAKLAEAAAALLERERASQAGAEGARNLRARLDRRLADLDDEALVAVARARQVEAEAVAHGQRLREEEDALERECCDATSLADDLAARLSAVKSDVAECERQAEEARLQREHRLHELAKQHEEERRKDSERSRATLEAREIALVTEREDMLQGQRAVADALTRQIEARRIALEAQTASIADLELRLSELEARAERNAQLAAAVHAGEQRVKMLSEEHQKARAQVQALTATATELEAETKQLDRTAQQLATRLEEEKRLKQTVRDHAAEAAAAAAADEAAREQIERSLARLATEKAALEDQAAAVEADTERMRLAQAAELDQLRRSAEDLKRELAQRDGALRLALQQAALKQARLAEYEEERRRLERELLARRVAAQHAAKAAISELE